MIAPDERLIAARGNESIGSRGGAAGREKPFLPCVKDVSVA
jgi:hypothetical protein